MKRAGVFFALVAVVAVFTVSAHAAPMSVSVVRADGAPAGASDFPVEVRRTADADGGETVACRVVSAVDGTNLVRIVARLPLTGDETMVFDGYDEYPFGQGRSRPLLLDDTFLMGAAWKANGPAPVCGAGSGVALALGADSPDSYADFSAAPGVMEISVHAAFVKRGGVYETMFHAFPFCAKYGVRDALARYYGLYPKRFRRNPDVDPAIYGISASYGSWRISDSEKCRQMNATWEWCITAARLWGDINGRERPTGRRNTDYSWEEGLNWTDRRGGRHALLNADLSVKEYSDILDGRLSDGYFCGVINAYYAMALAKISPVIAARYPDSIAVGTTFTDGGFSFATEVFVFPELSWDRHLRGELAVLAATRDIGALAFDVAFPRGVFRGARLAEMKNVSWDELGPGIVRGVGAGMLFDYIHTLNCRKTPYRMGVISNSNGKHISDKLHADTVMAESAPWDEKAPFPLRRRYVAGEKGLTLWEGFKPRQFAPDFKQWPKEAQHRFINALAECSVHRGLFAGASLPANCFLSEYTACISHAFVRMNEAGWKPVQGAVAEGSDWQVARYGLGDGAYLAVNNLARDARTAKLSVFPAEIDSGRAGCRAESACGHLFVPFFGGDAENAFLEYGENVSCEVGGLLSVVLECVGRVKGKGAVAVGWHGAPGRVTLKVESRDFDGEIVFRNAIEGYALQGRRSRRLSPGGTASAVYVDDWMSGAVAAIRAAPKQEMVEIVHAADDESMMQAERAERFFAAAAGKGKAPPMRVDTSLPPHTVSVVGFQVSAQDRWSFAVRMKRFLDALNLIRYPRYRPQIPMPNAARTRYRLMRL